MFLPTILDDGFGTTLLEVDIKTIEYL